MRPIVLLWVWVLVALPGAVGAVAASVGQGADLATLREKEWQRLAQITAWAKGKKPTQKELFLKINEPILEGNKKDYTRNLGYAQKYRERAENAARSLKDKDAAQNAQVAELFEYYAKQNKRIVEAILKGDGKEMEAGFGEVKKIEARILKVTGQTYKREWLMPDELQTAGGAGTAPAPAPKPTQGQAAAGTAPAAPVRAEAEAAGGPRRR
jgi:hypothetical protein